MKQTITQAVKKSDSLPSTGVFQHAAVLSSLSHQPRSTGAATRPLLQTKLKISEPGDRYEQEADRVADQIMRMPKPQLQRKECLTPGCREEDNDEILQAKPAVGGESIGAQAAHPLIQNVLSSPGQPLDSAARSFMEPRFGQDFSRVRVHTDSKAAESARAVNARAYTVGRDIVFGKGQYTPGSDEGKRLVAHELVHVGQQSQSGSRTYLALKQCPKVENWHQEALTKIIKFAGNSDGKTADKRWPELKEYICRLPPEKAKSLHDRFTDCPGDDFSKYMKNKFPKKHNDLMSILRIKKQGKGCNEYSKESASISEPPLIIEPDHSGSNTPPVRSGSGDLATLGIDVKGRYKINCNKALSRYFNFKEAFIEFDGKSDTDFHHNTEEEPLAMAFLPSLTRGKDGYKGRHKIQAQKSIDKFQSKNGLSTKTTVGGSFSPYKEAKWEFFLKEDVTWDWYHGEIKFSFVMDLVEVKVITPVKIAPLILEGEFKVPLSNGREATFKGKVTVTFTGEPNWANIFPDIFKFLGNQGSRIGPMVSRVRTIGNLIKAASLIRGAASLGTAAIPLAFATAGAAQLYFTYRSVLENAEYKELGNTANQAVNDFHEGFLAYLGIEKGDSNKETFWKNQGQFYAKKELNDRVRRSLDYLKNKHPNEYDKMVDENFKAELREIILERLRENSGSLKNKMQKKYDKAIRSRIFVDWSRIKERTSQEEYWGKVFCGIGYEKPTPLQ